MKQRPEDNTAPTRILIVDNEALTLWAFQHYLEKLPGQEVATVMTGAEALQAFKQQPFHVLITNHQTSDMDGIALATHIRRLYPQTIIVMITARSSQALRERAASIPVQHILEKPVEFSQLRRVILEVLAG